MNPEPPDTSVAALVAAYDANLAALMSSGRIAPKTLALHRTQLRKLVRVVGDRSAVSLRVHHLAGVDLTHHFVRTLKAAYKWASEDDVGLVPRNPVAKLPTPPTGRRERILSRGELARLILAMPRHYRRYVWFCIQTVMRPGEVRALVWAQVDLAGRSVVLTKFKGKRLRKDGLKVRHVPLTPASCRYLARRQARGAAEGPVFAGPTGRSLSANAVRIAFRRARDRAGLASIAGEPVVNYTLRHTGATERLRRGVAINELAVMMGHTNTQMTARYQHLQPSDLVAAIDRMRPAR